MAPRNGSTQAPRAAAAPGRTRPKTVKGINLAFQGGGSHGAFTWGVCDRLLEDDRIAIEGISGTSAGAMNGAALVSGFARDGRPGARASLDNFWRSMAEAARYSMLQQSFIDKWMGGWKLDYSPSFVAFDLLSRLLSPYELNPAGHNPLDPILRKAIDFEALRSTDGMKLYVSATNVRTGKIRVFDNPEMRTEVLLASACLPFMFHAVEIDGEHYWDGGYMGNPALFPLIYSCESKDIIIIQINPLHRQELPKTARQIMDRVNEISFNSSLMREMRAVQFVSHLIDAGQLDPASYKKVNIHLIEAEAEMNELGASTKLNADPEFLEYLRQVGRDAADRWLQRNFDMIGTDSTVDLMDTYF